jgi:hypothetical protein
MNLENALGEGSIKVPITARPSDWYYLFRLEAGIEGGITERE